MNQTITPGEYKDVMPDMSDEEYESLKESIRQNGFDPSTPIVVDETGQIIDGHHRFRACRELDIDPITVTVEESSIERALRTNLARRDLSSGATRKAVKRYLENHHDGERTQAEVAADLGVSQATVSRAWTEIHPESVSKETQRQQVRAILNRDPDTSSREVAERVDGELSKSTVNNWRREWDDQTPEPEPETEDSEEEAGEGESDHAEVESPTEESPDTDTETTETDESAGTTRETVGADPDTTEETDATETASVDSDDTTGESISLGSAIKQLQRGRELADSSLKTSRNKGLRKIDGAIEDLEQINEQ